MIRVRVGSHWYVYGVCNTPKLSISLYLPGLQIIDWMEHHGTMILRLSMKQQWYMKQLCKFGVSLQIVNQQWYSSYLLHYALFSDGYGSVDCGYWGALTMQRKFGLGLQIMNRCFQNKTVILTLLVTCSGGYSGVTLWFLESMDVTTEDKPSFPNANIDTHPTCYVLLHCQMAINTAALDCSSWRVRNNHVSFACDYAHMMKRRQQYRGWFKYKVKGWYIQGLLEQSNSTRLLQFGIERCEERSYV